MAADPRIPVRPGPPWWWVRLRHAPAAELVWRTTRLVPRPPRPCPPGPAPLWPWPLPAAAGPVHLPAPLEAPDATDPKPGWHDHQHHPAMAARLEGQAVDLDPWWRTHRHTEALWTSAHAVAGRVPALALLGHREALWAHVDHLRRHPSRFTSAANHRVAELAAWALAHRCLADLPPPPPLRPVLTRQLHPDGWPREQSTAYLAHVLEWGLVAHRCGEDLADLLHRGSLALEATLSADGHPFAIGDDGGDVALPSGDQPLALDVLGCIRSALGQPAPPVWSPGLRARLLGLTDTPTCRPPGSLSFPDGGFTVLRSDRLVVGFDHGPLGMAPLMGHGHDNLLAVWAHRDGQPWLVGRGTSAYHDPAVRWSERGPWGTCGLVLDDRARALPHPTPFLWLTDASASLDRLRLAPEGGVVQGHHDAWPHVRHTRTVRLDGACLEVVDDLKGEGVHHVAIRWHLAPDHAAHPDGDDAHVLHSTLPLSVVPWDHAIGYGRTVPAQTLVAEGMVRLPATLRSRWTPRGSADE